MSEPTRYTNCWYCKSRFPLREIREHAAACKIRRQSIPTVPRLEPSAFKAGWENDTFSLTLDAGAIQRHMAELLREADDKIAEPVVIDWLRGRGYAVVKLDGPLSVECPNCQAKTGEPCTVPTNTGRREWRGDRYHDARRDRADGI